MTIPKPNKKIVGLLAGLMLAFLALYCAPDLPRGDFSGGDFGSDLSTSRQGARN